jgi:hypothetical protein
MSNVISTHMKRVMKWLRISVPAIFFVKLL